MTLYIEVRDLAIMSVSSVSFKVKWIYFKIHLRCLVLNFLLSLFRMYYGWNDNGRL